MLLLVRHGRTAANAARRLLGRLDVPLDELGQRQAEALGKVDSLRSASRVVCSPLERTRQTAAALGPPVTVDERWIEMDYGIYDGMALDAVPADAWRRWRSDLCWEPEGGESFAQVGARVRAACDDLAEEAASSDVVVVSHVSPIKLAVAWALSAPDETMWHLFLDTASLSRVSTATTGPSLSSFNETHHRPSV